MNYDVRVEQLQDRLESDEAVVLTPGPNFEYLTGFDDELEERHKLAVVTEEGCFLFLPRLMEEEYGEIESIEKVYTWSDSDDPVNKLEEAVEQEDLSANTVYIEDEMPARFVLDLRKVWEDADFELASEKMMPLRMVKSREEIERIEKASEIADKVVKDVIQKKVVGLTEKELKEFIEQKMEEYGGEEPSFETIVAAGENGAKPHHSPGDKVIEAGVPVVLDFGTRHKHYPSDQTRTLVFGDEEPSEKFKEVFEVVKESQEKAFQVVEPGIESGKIDRTAREVIEDAGFGEEFTHLTGHGVGLEVHEKPGVGRESDDELEPGMVFSVEPGIYIEGEFGVRIEDLLVVTEDGFRRLNTSPRGFEGGA